MAELVAIQVLRAVAALMVVLGHAQEDAARKALTIGLAYAPSHALPWRAGVDLFFVISGFIMVHASRPLFGAPGAAGTFLSRRVARIVPLYWLFSTISLAILVAANALSDRWPVPSPTAILGNFLFWPVDTFGDGIARPFNIVGWTLNYEMFFYAIFAAAIGASAGLAVLTVSACLGLAVAAGALLGPTAPALAFWSSPIVLEFVFGMVIALLMGHVVLDRGPRILLALGGLAIWAWDPLSSASRGPDWITANDLARVLAWGVPAALLVAAVTLGANTIAAKTNAPNTDRRSPSTMLSRGVAAVGDASYALYLVHPLVIVIVRKAWLAVLPESTASLDALVVAEMVAAIGAGLVVHRVIERPVTSWLRQHMPPAGLRTPRVSHQMPN